MTSKRPPSVGVTLIQAELADSGTSLVMNFASRFLDIEVRSEGRSFAGTGGLRHDRLLREYLRILAMV